MKVKHVMTSPVVSIMADTPILQAVRIMLQRRISGLPVVDQEGALIGIVTEGDFLRRVETGTERRRPHWLEFLTGPGRLAEEYARAPGRKVGEVMTPDPVTVTEDASLEDVVKLLEKHQIKRVPVVHGRYVVGIVSRANLLHALTMVSREAKPAHETDEAIQAFLLEEFCKQLRAPAILINPIVRNGVVELWGTIIDERTRRALVVAAQNVPGVKAVRDHLSLVDVKNLYETDEAIRARLITEIGKQPWAAVANINPIVRNGVVELWGTITDERERQALVSAAENVPGVKAVRDHLAWVDAASGKLICQPNEEMAFLASMKAAAPTSTHD